MTRPSAAIGKDWRVPPKRPKPPKPGAYLLNVGHDEGCPCLSGKPLPACTCKQVIYALERIGR
jgi:hypothetical protein